MKSKLSKGLFITFEGGEGSGKTTLIERVAHDLTKEGFSVLKTREPGGTHLGEEIRSILLKLRDEPISPYAELSLFLSSRAQHIFEKIQPALEANHIVLCDRFNDSSVAYQGAACGLGMDRVAELCRLIVGLEPHLTIYLDIDPQLGLARAKKSREQDRIEAKNVAFHRTIREAYLTLCGQNKGRFYQIDAAQSPEIVHQQAMHRIQALYEGSYV
jgi:dTMP kinase